MTPVMVAGGVRHSDEAQLEIVRSHGDDQNLRLSYPRSAPASGSYSIIVGPRLSAVLHGSEHGWIARAPDLNALGYGDTVSLAVGDLCDSVEQYLEFIREDAPELAPEIAHHATYVQLLDAPRGAWFASVSMDASALE